MRRYSSADKKQRWQTNRSCHAMVIVISGYVRLDRTRFIVMRVSIRQRYIRMGMS